MAAFAEVYRQRGSIADRYFAVVEEAQKCRETEYNAALVLQGAWRQYLERKQRAREHQMAVRIQSVFRRHQARVLVRCLRIKKDRVARIAYFNIMATMIQKAWRGHQSRQKVFNYYGQKRPGEIPAIETDFSAQYLAARAAVPPVFQPEELKPDAHLISAVQTFIKTLNKTGL